MRIATIRWGLLAVAGLVTAGVARADIDTTPFWDGSSYVFDFGVPNSATYGETITAPNSGSTNLTSFTFYIDGPSTQSFQGYVYAWDGSEATGPALYTSPTISLTGSGPFSGDFEAITFSTGGVALAAGSQYVLFASVSDPAIYATSSGLSDWGQTQSTDTYSGGEFVFLNNGGDPSQWTSTAWNKGYLGTGGDLAFKASFGSASVPEPSSLALIVTGGLAGLARARRRRVVA